MSATPPFSNSEVKEYDVAVIGAGMAGCAAAKHAAGFGLSTALIEANTFGPGGTFLHNGALARCAIARNPGLTWERVQELTRKTTEDAAAVLTTALKEAGVALVTGRANFADERNIVILDPATGDDKGALSAKCIIISTGYGVLAVDPQRARTDGFSPRDAFKRESAPETAVVIGYTMDAFDLARILSSLHVQVILIPGERGYSTDDAASMTAAMFEDLQRTGVAVLDGITEWSIESGHKRIKRVRVIRDGTGIAYESDLVVDCQPPQLRRQRLGTLKLGVEPDTENQHSVDQFQRTSLTHVYAAGHCTNRLMSYRQAIINAVDAAKHVAETITNQAIDEQPASAILRLYDQWCKPAEESEAAALHV